MHVDILVNCEGRKGSPKLTGVPRVWLGQLKVDASHIEGLIPTHLLGLVCDTQQGRWFEVT